MKLDIFAQKELTDIIGSEMSERIYTIDSMTEKVIEWIRDREKKEKEDKFDTWFYNLSVGQKADNADVMWDGLSYGDKKEIYELE